MSFPAPSAPVALLPLVDRIGRAVRRKWPLPHGFEYDDLLSEGTIGLLEACRRYDGSRRCGLSTFASYRIRGAMLDALRRRYSEVNREVLLGDVVSPGVWTLAEDIVPYGAVLREKVAALSEADQALLFGRLEGDSFTELGRQLGKSKAQAFRRHQKVLATLRDELTLRR